ncbi:MAG: Smr/MutS family protein [Verrucomicrobia bacterium]|nr:Smr/MutS family protein [Verrucomicrobiota bacterium]MCF7708659.1 Smr/MutS family protein [Verrucomicrobiota bacterium]
MSNVNEDTGPVDYPVDGMLDLHTFRPRDAAGLVRDYLDECRRKGILKVRIVHGKGTGALRETVHSVLRKLDTVESFELAGEYSGSWGATIATLKP